ncbi:MAG: bifunctional MaoC family dehydratase N-terminal/OB-fold nucleic acid binding domain-containing protein, partial [Nocardioides sp.]
QPMINNWVEAMGDTDPRWQAGEAPPAMLQVWTMGGLHPKRDPADPLHSMMTVLTEAGFAGVLGTNCEQEYARTLRVGEELTVTTRLESVVGPKQTGVGEGYFVTTRNVWRVGGEAVASMLFRVLKFVPKSPEPDPGDFVLRPQQNRDTAYFWEGTQAGELRIQTCNACGALRHPPGPACPECGAMDRGHLVASGRGTVFSYVVHRHPPVPGRELPILLVLVDLEEGVRMVGELVDTDPEKIEIGMPVVVDFRRIDDDLALPVWRPA